MAILGEQNTRVDINPTDVKRSFYRGSGAGGQHRNKKDTAVRLQYDGIIVTSENERSQDANLTHAWKELEKRVRERMLAQTSSDRRNERKSQVGSGMRGDKRRTYRERDDRVVDHVTGRKTTLKRVLRGDLGALA